MHRIGGREPRKAENSRLLATADGPHQRAKRSRTAGGCDGVATARALTAEGRAAQAELRRTAMAVHLD